MKNYFFRMSVMALIAITTVIAGCKSGQKATTPQQKSAMNRGAKMEKEECEEMARISPARASGNGVSQSERLAKNSAALNARQELASTVKTALIGMGTNFEEQFKSNKDGSYKGRDVNFIGGLVDGSVTASIICSNTYVKDDGSYNVYVCVEMDKGSLDNLYNKISRNEELSIKFDEKMFKDEMDRRLKELREQEEK